MIILLAWLLLDGGVDGTIPPTPPGNSDSMTEWDRYLLYRRKIRP